MKKKQFYRFQSLQLFTSVVMDSAGIDYHVSLMANAFQKCLDVPELQPELLCALVKQTTPHIIPHSKGHTGQTSSGGGVQVKRQHSIKHPRVSSAFFSLVCDRMHSTISPIIFPDNSRSYTWPL